jgi:hypothetical protein
LNDGNAIAASSASTPSNSTNSYPQKRTIDQIVEQQHQRQNQMKMKRNCIQQQQQQQQHQDISGDSDMNESSIDNMNADDIFLPAAMQPQVTINESPRFDASNVKREGGSDGMRPQSPSTVYRNPYRELNTKFITNTSLIIFSFSQTYMQIVPMRCKILPFHILTTSLRAICRSAIVAVI